VLRAARAAAHEAGEPPTLRWGFTRFDLLWAAALVLLVAANGLLSLERRHAATTMAEKQGKNQRSERTAEGTIDLDLELVGMALGPGRSKRFEPALTFDQVLRESW